MVVASELDDDDIDGSPNSFAQSGTTHGKSNKAMPFQAVQAFPVYVCP